MNVLAINAAMLLAGAPADTAGSRPVEPVLVAAPAASDEDLQFSAVPSATAETRPPAAPAESLSRMEPVPPVPSTDLDPGDIVVTAQRRSAPGDPLEKVNAKSFAVTQKVDDAFVAPVARAYERSVPGPVRSGLRNFLNNLHEPNVFLNFLLQLKPGKAAETLGRFAINSTIGGAGLFDVAKRRPFKLPRRANGFADSLGYYGVKPGPFLFLPLIGPTTLRDLVGGGLDGVVLPLSVGPPFNRVTYTVPTAVLREFDNRNQFDEQLTKLRETADPYAAAREFYFQRRQREIDDLRGRGRGEGGSKSAPAIPATTSIAPPALQAVAPAGTPSPAPGIIAATPGHEAVTLNGRSGRGTSSETPEVGVPITKALDRPAIHRGD